ncbi:HNH endonuclease family protein [Streptomyces sp. NPDC012888]|uniref:HNH endonuclease family protein n=1 Tax=Streptomyces sp. NPDC012888 TaxID=3364855 RepID=UPI0036CD9F71
MRSRPVPTALLLLPAVALAGCTPAPDPAGGGTGGPNGAVQGPLTNPEGVRPGLAPIDPAADRAAARALLDRLGTRGRGPRTGYDRKEFGPAWTDTADGVPMARNGCDTRNDVLRRDGGQVRFRAGSDCVVVSMTLRDPYTGKDIAWKKEKAAEVQIDHVVPLSYAWQLGADRWDAAKRRRLANDTLNLLAVDGPANSAKGDSGPASWLPPHRGVRCAYAVRFAQVALKYELPVTAPDKAAMLAQCGG